VDASTTSSGESVSARQSGSFVERFSIEPTAEGAFSYLLIGENHFYGRPRNARAPGRVPGGSSSGSASAVACGLVDFALGSDAGSTRRNRNFGSVMTGNFELARTLDRTEVEPAVRRREVYCRA
jgi:hypothetical protein